MAVEINLTYHGGLHCTATHGPSRQTLNTDAPVDNGGKGAAFSPTDLMATALGTCMATVMGLVAERNQLDISGLQIQVIKEMTATPVRRIASLKTRLVFPQGKALSAHRPCETGSRRQRLPRQTEPARRCADADGVRLPGLARLRTRACANAGLD